MRKGEAYCREEFSVLMLFNNLHWWDVGESRKRRNIICLQAGKGTTAIIRFMHLDARFSGNGKLGLLSSVPHRQSVCSQ